ncbi:MAG TPA: class 1 fructose-bisphosphatase [Chitinophagaceae bacterium]|nr:class 1 fructose-bisphosphatase [Chitinophagaceae bacterium]
MPVTRHVLTLDEFTVQQLRIFPHATGELSTLLREIGLAAKRINVEVNQAGIADILGNTGYMNVHAEAVQQLDVFAHNQLRNVLKSGISCAGIASEEMESIEAFDDEANNRSKYVVAFDPLDGSSNIDTNISIGTIFGVYRRVTETATVCRIEDFLQPGVKQVAAGYIIYGSSTILVYATRRGVNGFTLDPSIGEFCLSHPDMQCPANSRLYSVNLGYASQYPAGIQAFLHNCQKQTYSLRYVGSMVADLHRTLIKGGIFLNPPTLQKPQGKLRLLYECNPFAFILEVAGGKAINGHQRILEIQPTCLHGCTPVYMGSANLVNDCATYLKQMI